MGGAMASWANRGQTQQNQVARVTSTLGDKLLLAGFTATERLSEPFTLAMEVLSEKELDLIPHLGPGSRGGTAGEARAPAPRSPPVSIAMEVRSEKELDFIPHLGTGFGVDMSEDAALARPFNGVLF